MYKQTHAYISNVLLQYCDSETNVWLLYSYAALHLKVVDKTF